MSLLQNVLQVLRRARIVPRSSKCDLSIASRTSVVKDMTAQTFVAAGLILSKTYCCSGARDYVTALF